MFCLHGGRATQLRLKRNIHWNVSHLYFSTPAWGNGAFDLSSSWNVSLGEEETWSGFQSALSSLTTLRSVSAPAGGVEQGREAMHMTSYSLLINHLIARQTLSFGVTWDDLCFQGFVRQHPPWFSLVVLLRLHSHGDYLLLNAPVYTTEYRSRLNYVCMDK